MSLGDEGVALVIKPDNDGWYTLVNELTGEPFIKVKGSLAWAKFLEEIVNERGSNPEEGDIDAAR